MPHKVHFIPLPQVGTGLNSQPVHFFCHYSSDSEESFDREARNELTDLLRCNDSPSGFR